MAAHASHLGIDHVNVGRPMEFWKRHMPEGMLLRSASDWHLDTLDEDTIEAFLAERGQAPADVEPLSLDLYLRYAAWFQERKALAPLPLIVERLDLAASWINRRMVDLEARCQRIKEGSGDRLDRCDKIIALVR